MSTTYTTRTIPTTSYTWRTVPTTSYTTPRTYVLTQLGEISWTLGAMAWILWDYYTWIRPASYTVRTPI